MNKRLRRSELLLKRRAMELTNEEQKELKLLFKFLKRESVFLVQRQSEAKFISWEEVLK